MELKTHGLKYILAALFVSAGLFSAQISKAAPRCDFVYRWGMTVSWEKATKDWDTSKFEKTWENYSKEWLEGETRVVRGMSDLGPFESTVPLTPEIRNQARKNLDIGLMGVLGRLYDIEPHPLRKTRNVVKATENAFREMTPVYQTELERISKARLSPKFYRRLNKILDIERLTDDTILVHHKNFFVESDLSDEVASALRSRIMTTYLHVVNWVYRLSNLEQNLGLSSMKMMDETVLLIKEGRALHFNLLYDSRVFLTQMKLLQTSVEKYESASTPEEKKKWLEKISQPEDPFLPMAGIIASESFLHPEEPVELKRYFKNDLEDPLQLLHVSEKNDFVLRHRMTYRVIEKLPPHTPLEIHAHSQLHADAYVKLGFTSTGFSSNPKYPSVQVNILKAKREDVLAKISDLLKSKE